MLDEALVDYAIGIIGAGKVEVILSTVLDDEEAATKLVREIDKVEQPQ